MSLSPAASPIVQSVLQDLLLVWSDFDTRLDCVPILDKLNRGKFRLDDYRLLLLNLRQQVIEGSGWISRAASSPSGFRCRRRAMRPPLVRSMRILTGLLKPAPRSRRLRFRIPLPAAT